MSKGFDILESYILSNAETFDAPYGILTGEHKDQKGRAYESITFGIRRTLDAEVRSYGGRWFLLRSSRTRENTVFQDVGTLIEHLAVTFHAHRGLPDEEDVIE